MQIDARFIAENSITKALSVLGDRWKLLILVEAFRGAHRFAEFRSLSGAYRSTLASRLAALVDDGLFERVRYSETPERYEYKLTAKGLDLYWTSLAMWRWEHSWAPRSAAVPGYLRHRACGHQMLPEVTCSHCKGAISTSDTRYELVTPSARRRAEVAQFRRSSRSSSDMQEGGSGGFAQVADILGDRWTPLVLSVAWFGMRRFDEIHSTLEIATNILADRLNHLVEQNILEKREYSERPRRHEYRLTAKGRDLFPHALLLKQWGDRWLSGGSAKPNLNIYHKTCGRLLGAIMACSHCREPIRPLDATFPPTSARVRKPPRRASVS